MNFKKKMRAELSFQQEKTGTKRKIRWSCPYYEISHEDEPWSGELCSWGEDHLILVHLVLSVKPVSKELLSVLVLCSCSLLYAEEHNRFNLSHLCPVLWLREWLVMIIWAHGTLVVLYLDENTIIRSPLCLRCDPHTKLIPYLHPKSAVYHCLSFGTKG